MTYDGQGPWIHRGSGRQGAASTGLHHNTGAEQFQKILANDDEPV